MIIDAYTHFCSKEFLRYVMSHHDVRLRAGGEVIGRLSDRWPQFTDLNKRLTYMDRYKIDVQVAAVHNRIEPARFPLSPSDEINVCKILNESMADVSEKSGGRILCLGSVPLNSLENGGVDEMRRAVKELGLKGFMVLTNVHGIPVDKFTRFWEVAKELNAVVYIHPTDPYQTSCRSYEDEFDLSHVVGWPFETTLILLRMVLSGMMDKLRGLSILAHHAGGMIPFFMGRIVESYSEKMTIVKADQIEEVKVRGGLSEKFRESFFYDTAVGGSSEALRCAYQVFGVDRLVYATDFPYGPDGGVERLEKYPQTVKALNLSEDEWEKIMHRNAEKMLKL